MGLWDILVDRVAKQTESLAILSLGRQALAYGHLPDCIDSVRLALNGFGLGRGDVVATALPDDADTAVCLLGVICCATLAPLNPDYTDHEFERYLTRLRPKAIIVPAGR